MATEEIKETKPLNFIEEIVENDLAQGKYSRIITRFPPEPNGYLHIGHASSIVLNFGLTESYNGYTNLRFDDTNPVTEDTAYVEAIRQDVRWLGFKWENELYASDYFGQLYEYALTLIRKGFAYVDDSSSEEMAAQKGTPTSAGTESPFRTRSIEENLSLFEAMKAGDYPDGSKTLRAKIDMAHPNMIMRDPILYRIKHAAHHRTGDTWKIYPMYDFAHGQSDSLERVTHSLCTLEFVPHRELYDWLIEKLEIYPSHQYEFARRNVNHTVTSKRKLMQLVNENFVSGWDDPRMPTIAGMRRRGYTPESIRDFVERIGVSKRENSVDLSLLEFCVREHLNKIALRRMVVLDPLKITITNFPAGQKEICLSENNPESPSAGSREVPFTREIFIERDDFMENPPKKYHRLSPGQYARLKSAFIIRCDEVVKDAAGEVTEIKCSYIENSKSGQDTSGINAKATLHWVSATDAVPVEVRLYDRLFTVEDPGDADGDFKDYINPESLKTITGYAEPALATDDQTAHFQFLRLGYFFADKDSRPEKPVFNRTTTLRDNYAKGAGK
ncbi:glutamine--tRNA ligase/YqeY domain fusion protein [Ravibacter arvi]|uniref:Glutamine--tRNA ligase n=1 Tax=Ravibacter arvi TaxID=2051041 RepID=A0ABP8LJQ4_9BACT